MNTLRKGDRGTVGFEVTGDVDAWGNPATFVRIDGGDGNWLLPPEAIARATILPRKLGVGDPVLIGDDGEFAFRIEAITGPMAALSRDGILRCIKPLSELTPIDSDEPSDDGWREWKGGECPVSADTLVDARLRHGWVTQARRADWFEWWHKPGGAASSDIIAYRIVKEAE